MVQAEGWLQLTYREGEQRLRPQIRTGDNCVIYQHPRRCKMPAAKPTAPRRRNRKRKRRLASSSSSSSPSSDSSDSSSDDTSKETPVKKASLEKQATPPSAESSSSSPSPSPSSASSSDSENEDDASHVGEPATALIPSAKSRRDNSGRHPPAPARPRSPSPSPPPADAPPFLPPKGTSGRAQDEQALRNRFRQFWMASVADAFGDDLEQIRQVRLQP